jgi:hypothetical protein
MIQDPKLVRIHGLLDDAKERHNVNHKVDAVRLMLEDREFLKAVTAANNQKQVQIKTEADLDSVCFAYLMMFLLRRDYVSAATLCWGDEIFTYKPHSVQLIWSAVQEQRLINCLGAASSGKTYSPSAWMLLDWVLDPDWTLVRVMSTKEEHVKKNLFADMQRLYAGSVIKLPGKADTESIATEAGKKGGQGIFILVIPQGEAAKGAIRGSKVKPRPAHPLFGTSSRTRLLIDEAQDVPVNAFEEIPNLFSSIEEGDMEHTKILMGANPKDEFSRYGLNCIPVQGWEEPGKEIRTRDSKIETWTSTTGWFCVRLNALYSENMTEGRTIYPRFFTRNGYVMKLRTYSGDVDHPMMWAEVYGMFPPKGHMTTIVQKHWVDRSHGEWLFETATRVFVGVDVGFTGDLPTMTASRVGRAKAWMDFEGTRHDLEEATWKIQIDTVGILPRGDTQDLANEIMSRCKVLNVKPEDLAIDRTGIGQGTHDNIRRQWRVKVDGLDPNTKDGQESVDIMGINYSESATEEQVSEEDTRKPKELYYGIRSELWYVTGKYFEYDVIRLGRGVDHQTVEELVNRRGGSPSGKKGLLQVESKDDFKSRGFSSPDRADSLTECVQCARIGESRLMPKAPDTTVAQDSLPNVLDPDSWPFGVKMGEPVDMGFDMGAGKINTKDD